MKETRAVPGIQAIVFCACVTILAPSPAAFGQGEDSGIAGTAKEKRTESPVYMMLMREDYAGLERHFGALVDSYLSGEIKEKEFGAKFAVFRTEGLDARFDAWVAAYPRSYPARLARGINRIEVAWQRRGTKFADKTSDDAAKGFEEMLKLAAADLDASLKLNAKPVESYRYLLRVALGFGMGEGGRRILDAALKLDPQAYHPRDEYLYVLTPKWGGSREAMRAFIEECRQSPLPEKDKAALEAEYHNYLADDSRIMHDYKAASESYRRAWDYNNLPVYIMRSGNAARDGGFYDRALILYDELLDQDPKNQAGLNQRGRLRETHFKDYGNAFKDYLASAELGNSWAQNKVGWWYLTGKHVGQNLDKAELYLRYAAAQHNRTALANLRKLEHLRGKEGGAR